MWRPATPQLIKNWKIQTQIRSNEPLFILTRTHSMQIFGEMPAFVKPQNDTLSTTIQQRNITHTTDFAGTEAHCKMQKPTKLTWIEAGLGRWGEEKERESSNSKSLILNDSSVRSIWTYLTASPCYTTNTNMQDYTTNR